MSRLLRAQHNPLCVGHTRFIASSPTQRSLLRLRPTQFTRNASLQTPIATTTTTQSIKPPSVVQKVGRATATGSYFILVSAGVALLGVVVYALGSNLFFETRYLNEAVAMIKADPEVKRLLGDDIQAYGQRSTHRGRRGGGVVSQRTESGHVFMLFHVSGSTGIEGTCRLDVQEKSAANAASEIKQLYCDVPGYNRIWLKREPTTVQKKRKKWFGF